MPNDTTPPMPLRTADSVRAWLRHAAHVCYVFTPTPARWKNRIAHLLYGMAGWIFRGDRNYEIWKGRDTVRRIASGVAPIADDQVDAVLASIRFPDVARPLVLIVIPRLRRAQAHPGLPVVHPRAPARGPVEVIVAEDASGDPPILRLREIQGLRFLLNAANLGFVRSCNAAARQARGEHPRLTKRQLRGRACMRSMHPRWRCHRLFK